MKTFSHNLTKLNILSDFNQFYPRQLISDLIQTNVFLTWNFFNSSDVNGPIETIVVFCNISTSFFSSRSFVMISKKALTEDALVKIIPSTLFCEKRWRNSFHCDVSRNAQTSYRYNSITDNPIFSKSSF